MRDHLLNVCGHLGEVVRGLLLVVGPHKVTAGSKGLAAGNETCRKRGELVYAQTHLSQQARASLTTPARTADKPGDRFPRASALGPLS